MLHEPFHEIELKEISPDILHTKFLKEELCNTLLNICLEEDTWTNNPKQPYRTDDIHFEKDLPEWKGLLEIGLLEALKKACMFWDVDEDVSIASLFAIRYKLDSIKQLKKHHDDSFITGSIKLNNNYSGGNLFFPRQKFYNTDIGVGDLLFWPGQITHIHGSTPLSLGEKYSITIWTKNESLANHR